MRCEKCNTLNAKSSKFCYSCGAELPVEDETEGLVKPVDTDNDEESPILLKPAENESAIANDGPTADKEVSAVRIKVGPQNQKDVTGNDSGVPKGVRIVLALLACFGIYIAYTIIGVILGWKHGGGIIPMLIMFSLMGVTWRAITGQKKDK